MKTIESTLQELSEEEKRNLEGGNWILWAIGAAVYLYNNREDLIEGFKEGYEAAKKSGLIKI